MVDIDKLKDPSPWIPMQSPIGLKHLGKLAEELSECGSAVARCIIQGIDEAEPVTGKLNRAWLEDEIADVYANLELCIIHFNLDLGRIHNRVLKKKEHLSIWHRQLPK